jgi:hypothetical protein
MLRVLVRRVESRAKRISSSVGDRSGDGDGYLNSLFEEQRAFVEDPAPYVAALCTRRAGKTFALAARFARTMENRAGALVVYIAPTRKMCRRIMWPELKRFARTYGLRWRFLENELAVQTSKGSTLLLIGCDRQSEVDKIRGVAAVDIAVDEAGVFKDSILDPLINESIWPTLEDYGGTLLLTGTPGRVCSGIFHEVTTGQRSGWSVHRWSVLNNAQFPRWQGRADWRDAAQAWFKHMLEVRGLHAHDASVRREWFGEWAQDSSALVYHFDPTKNVGEPPQGLALKYIGGLDLGYKDATGFAVVAYSPGSPKCWAIHTEKHRKWDVSQVAERLRGLQQVYNCDAWMVDTGGLGKMIVEEMRRRYGMALRATRKTDKMAFVEMLNADLRCCNFFVRPEAPVIKEWLNLYKNEDGDEQQGQENNLADAVLYAYRECRHYRYQETAPGMDPLDAWEQKVWAVTPPDHNPDKWGTYDGTW